MIQDCVEYHDRGRVLYDRLLEFDMMNLFFTFGVELSSKQCGLTELELPAQCKSFSLTVLTRSAASSILSPRLQMHDRVQSRKFHDKYVHGTLRPRLASCPVSFDRDC
jgi:hypothetical protein